MYIRRPSLPFIPSECTIEVHSKEMHSYSRQSTAEIWQLSAISTHALSTIPRLSPPPNHLNGRSRRGYFQSLEVVGETPEPFGGR